MATERMGETSRAIVSSPDGLRSPERHGVVEVVQPSGYMILLDGDPKARHFTERKCRPESRRKPALLARPDEGSGQLSAGRATFSDPGNFSDRPVVPIPKPAPAARSESYKAMVRTHRCCHCRHLDRPREAHHEGRRGVSLKCSDYLTVPLCGECHDSITNKHRLPRAGGGLHSIEESRAILCREQRRLLTAVVVEALQRPAISDSAAVGLLEMLATRPELSTALESVIIGSM